jgi:hypothetical protein
LLEVKNADEVRDEGNDRATRAKIQVDKSELENMETFEALLLVCS